MSARSETKIVSKAGILKVDQQSKLSSGCDAWFYTHTHTHWWIGAYVSSVIFCWVATHRRDPLHGPLLNENFTPRIPRCGSTPWPIVRSPRIKML
jgi:hypothetical protein